MKSLNKLWIYGDSYSKGLGVTDDTYQYDYYKGKEDLIWSRLLAKELQVEEVNKALNGISNDMIFDIIKETFDEGLAIMAVDNLPSELPRDSSKEFGDGIVREVIPYMLNEDDGRILNATITLNGSFLEKYNYLNDYIKSA